MMGRNSSSGTRYLIFQTENGNASYQRAVPRRLRPHMRGRITYGWNGGTYEVCGQATIKIALPLGPLSSIESSWAKVHAQVEDIVRDAIDCLDRDNRFRILTTVGEIRPPIIRQMLDQARHDVLAADDSIRTKRTDPSGLALVVHDLLKRGGHERPTLAEAQRKAQDVEFREAWRRLAQDDPEFADRDFEEGEIDIDPSLLEKISDRGKLRDLDGNRLDENERKAVFRALRNVKSMPSDVAALLESNGISIPRDHPDRLQLGLDLARTKVAAHGTVQGRRAGDATLTPERPPLVSPVPRGPTLSEMRLKWIARVKPVQKPQDDNLLYLNLFIGMFGDLPVEKVTRAMIREFRDLLAKRPRNMPRAMRLELLRDQVAWGETQRNCPVLTAQTVNAKGIGSLSAIMRTAIKEDAIEKNPCQEQLLETDGNALDRLPYDASDINAIAASPVYADGKEWEAGGGAAAFWFPLIGMFAGARLEEIGQLLVADVKQQDGIYYFDFTEFDEEAETAGVEGESKRLKTSASRRPVPIHPFLILIGFLDYVARMKASKKKYLFPDLKPYRQRRTRTWSKWWGRYCDKYVTKSARKVFHSFRHGFMERLRNITGSNEAGEALAGHKKHMYGRTLSLEKRHEIICNLNYPDVNLTLFQDAASRLFKW